MSLRSSSMPDYARKTLASIRLFNGAVALVAPGLLLRRLGVDPQVKTPARYIFRMFGIRTVLIGAELLMPEGKIRDHAIRNAVIIHATDATAALLAGLSGQVPRRSGVMIVLISTFNTVLALLMRQTRA